MKTTWQTQVDSYVDGVLSGRIVAGSLVRAACQRYQDDLATAADRGFRFDAESATADLDFICCLSHTAGEYAGEPFIPRLFQAFILWNLFGWKRIDTGLRRFRKAFISMGRGEGKSPLAAAIANKCFVFDGEPRAEVYAIATKEKQARDVVWKEAAEQIGKSKSRTLKDHVTIQVKNMHVPETGAKFEPLGSDSETNDGWRIHCAVLDEIHAWKESHRGLLDVIETALGKCRQPLRIIITTAGTDESHIWIEEHDWAEQVVMGQQKADDLFVFIAEIDQDEPCPKCHGADGGCEFCETTGRVEIDCLDEKYWPQAHPMLNEPRPTTKVDELRSLAARARVQPSMKRRFKRYYANQIIASYSSEYPVELWIKGNRPLSSDLKGRRCFAGFDYGHTRDLAALSVVWPLVELGEYHVRSWAFAPRDHERDLGVDPWATFVRNGSLRINDGSAVDPEAIYSLLKWLQEEYELASMAFDPSNAREFGTYCLNTLGIPIFSFPQTPWKYNEPMEGVSEALRAGKLCHGGDPLLAWSAKNTVVRVDSMNRRMPHKPKSKEKIDPIVALLMAFSEAKFAEAKGGETKSVYQTRGVIDIGGDDEPDDALATVRGDEDWA